MNKKKPACHLTRGKNPATVETFDCKIFIGSLKWPLYREEEKMY